MEQVEIPYDQPHDEMTVLDKAQSIGITVHKPAYMVSVLLACAEAEHEMNKWLDVLRDPLASKYKKTKARKFLREHSEEFGELCQRRDATRRTIGVTIAKVRL